MNFELVPQTAPEASSDGAQDCFDSTVRFGSILLDYEECLQHFLIAGATGSGKTTLMQLMLQDVLPDVRPGSDVRALIYDAKEDLMSRIRGVDREVRVVTLNPFDDRGAAWDMAADIKEPRVAIEIAFTLFPEQQESQPFFSAAARHFIYGVMLSFIHRGLEWGFADVIRALLSPKRLRRVLAASPFTRSMIPRYFGDPKLLSNILSTVATKLLPFEPIAACWESASEKVSLEDWIKNEYVLVLGNSEISRHAIDAINRCIFKRATDLHLGQSESKKRRTFWFLDELSEAGRLDGLISLTKKCRSKGGCVVIAFQTIGGLEDENLYGKSQTAEIIGQMGNKAIGRLECPDTAEWASKIFGEREILQTTTNRSWSRSSGKDGGSGSYSESENEQFVTQRSVLPSEFLSLPPCSDVNGLTALYISRVTGAFWSYLPGSELYEQDIAPSADDVPDFLPRAVETQYLRPWTKDEVREFAPPRKRNSANTETKPKSKLSALKELQEFFQSAKASDEGANDG